jgi:thioesterase domain-containing protein
MAYELAQQLVASGEPVASVVIVDAALRNGAVLLPYRALALACRALRIADRRRDDIFVAVREPLVRLSPRTRDGAPAGWAAWLGVLAAGVARMVQRRLTRRAAPADDGAAASEGDRDAVRRGAFYERASHTYLPRPYSGPVTVLLSTDWAMRDGERIGGEWRALCPRLDVRVVPGSHRSIVSAERDVLGPAIRAALGDALPGTPTGANSA